MGWAVPKPWSDREPAGETKKPVSRQAVNRIKIEILTTDVSLVTNIGHQGHEPGSFHGISDRVLTDRGATRLASSHQPTMTINQFLEQLDIFVVNVHRARSLTVNIQRIFANGFDFELWFLTDEFFLKLWQAINPLTQIEIDTVAVSEFDRLSRGETDQC